jgi:catechol 2,3-dioxygenase-like lactoylglutathione lyase family enzyme
MTLDNSDQIAGLKSINLTTDHPDTTAQFYREVLQLPIAQEQHRGTARHWAGQVGNQHFAIHQREGFWLPASAHDGNTRADTIVSFTGAIEPFEARFAAHGIAVVAKTRIGPMSFIAVRDPDGRYVCIGTPWPERKRGEP